MLQWAHAPKLTYHGCQPHAAVPSTAVLEAFCDPESRDYVAAFPVCDRESLPTSHLQDNSSPWTPLIAHVSTLCSQQQANQHQTPAPSSRLSTKDLSLQVKSRELVPQFMGPFEVERVVNPAAVCLKLPQVFKIHPTFHI